MVTDTLDPALRVDEVTGDGDATVDGQTVTVTFPTLGPGETRLFNIVTTVVSGAEIVNEACLSADGVATRCAAADLITRLPETGERPWWRPQGTR